jgi:Fe-S oxidoreductase
VVKWDRKWFESKGDCCGFKGVWFKEAHGLAERVWQMRVDEDKANSKQKNEISGQ